MTMVEMLRRGKRKMDSMV